MTHRLTTTRSRLARSNDYGRDWPLHQRFQRSDGLDDLLGCDARPSWRGKVHMLGLITALPALALLIIFANTSRARVGVTIYAAGICVMLTASTTYHRWVNQMRSRAAWRRADHAMIFAAIAGSATPIILIVMPTRFGTILLCIVWAAAIIGAAFKLGRWPHGTRVGNALYPTVSALAAFAIPSLWIHGGVKPAALYLVSGALYMVGAHWFAQTRPRLQPDVFSYHEVWHSFTIAAAAAHFLAVWAIAT